MLFDVNLKLIWKNWMKESEKMIFYLIINDHFSFLSVVAVTSLINGLKDGKASLKKLP